MEIWSPHPPRNRFEQATLDTLAKSSLAGIAMNNIILPHDGPHPAFYRLPNEHDILVCMDGHLYTLDMKEFAPGIYRGSEDLLEYSADGATWKPLPERLNPYLTAFKKGRLLQNYVLREMRGMAPPQFVSAIVVPDEADVSALVDAVGRTARGARLLLTSLSGLDAVLHADATNSRQRKPAAAELAARLKTRVHELVKALPCWVNEYVRIEAAIGQPRRPLPREAYRGRDESRRGLPVRVEIMRQFTGDHSSAEAQRAFRTNLTALSRLRHDAILQHYTEFETHGAFVLVGEYFSEKTLETMRHSLQQEWVRPIFEQVISALRYAHSRGIVHRHVEPACIFLRLNESGPPDVRLGGFFGAAVDNQTVVQAARADDPYRAPEYDDDTRWRTPMEDAWSVGRCLCSVLTGDPNRLPAAGLSAGILQLIPHLLEAEPAARRHAWEKLGNMISSHGPATHC